jgi:hypothetical protein
MLLAYNVTQGRQFTEMQKGGDFLMETKKQHLVNIKKAVGSDEFAN